MTPEELKIRFYNEFWPLNKNGSSDSALSYLMFIISKRYTTAGRLLDYDLIFNKYKSYITKWNYEFGTRTKADSKFIGKDDKLKSIEDFLRLDMYNNSYEIVRGPRDLYLFRDKTTEELNTLVEEWKRIIIKARNRERI